MEYSINKSINIKKQNIYNRSNTIFLIFLVLMNLRPQYQLFKCKWLLEDKMRDSLYLMNIWPLSGGISEQTPNQLAGFLTDSGWNDVIIVFDLPVSFLKNHPVLNYHFDNNEKIK